MKPTSEFCLIDECNSARISVQFQANFFHLLNTQSCLEFSDFTCFAVHFYSFKNAEISGKIVFDDVVKSKNSKIKSYVFIEMEIYVFTEITLVDPEHNPSSN